MNLSGPQRKAIKDLENGEYADDGRNPKKTAVMKSLIRRGLVTKTKRCSSETPYVYRLAK